MIAVARRRPQLTFLALAIGINVAATTMAATTMAARRPELALAATLDMTVTVTAIYYWLIVRPGLRPKASLVFVALLGLLRASFAFPQVVPGRAFIAGAIELIAIGAAARILPSGIAGPAGRILPSGIAGPAGRILAGELAVFYYAFAWWARPELPAASEPFTMHQNSGIADLMMVLAPFSVFEIVPVHLLVAHWSHQAAWILTVLGLYSALWLFALGRSFALRPGYFNESEIVVRFGLLFSLRIPRECVRTLQREPIADAVLVPRSATPNLYLEFTHPLDADGLFGFTRRVGALGVCIDGPLPRTLAVL